LQGKILSIFVADAPQGRLRDAEEGFSRRFPSSRRGLRSFTPCFRHIQRRWGSIGSRAAAANCDRRGGEVVRNYTVTFAGVRDRVRNALRKSQFRLGESSCMPISREEHLQRALERPSSTRFSWTPKLVLVGQPNLVASTAYTCYPHSHLRV
jgi:hypothetical protein